MQSTGEGTVLARAQRGYLHVMMALGAAMMAATVLIMGVQVVYRYFLSGSLIWAEEMCRYLLVWMTFLFAGAAFQRGDIVAVELLTRAVPPRVRRWLMMPAYVVTALFLCALVWYGWRFAVQNTTQSIPAFDFIAQALTGRDSGLSMFWIYVSVPAGCALLALHMLVSAARMFFAPAPAAHDAPA